MKYRVFKRTWWRDNPDWPGGREPEMGTKRHVKFCATEAEAREFCMDWNRTHRPGRLSLKCEYEGA